MICLGLSPSGLNVAAIIFYTCILIPFRQLKESVQSFFGLLSSSCGQHQQPITLEPFYVDLNCLELEGINHLHYHQQMDDLPLPMVRFGDLVEAQMGEEESGTETCSVCLVEFDKEDQVTQLSRCGHVFHLCCIKSWVDRNRFTCPLCRSFLLQ